MLEENIQKLLSKNKETFDKHRNQRVFILGTGPSILDCDLTLLKDEITIAVNQFSFHPELQQISPDYYVTADPIGYKPDKEGGQLSLTKQILDNLKTLTNKPKVFFPLRYAAHLIDHPDFKNYALNWYLYEDSKNENERIDFSHSIPTYGQNILNIALMLACHLGVSEIYLIGFDTGGVVKSFDLPHFYGKLGHEEKAREIYTLSDLERSMYRHLNELNRLKRYVEKRNILVFNTSLKGSFKLFPTISYSSLFGREVLQNTNCPEKYLTDEQFMNIMTGLRYSGEGDSDRQLKEMMLELPTLKQKIQEGALQNLENRINEWLKDFSDVADLLFLSAFLKFHQNKLDNALDQLAKLHVLWPFHAEGYMLWAQIFVKLGKYDQARTKLAETMRIDPVLPGINEVLTSINDQQTTENEKLQMTISDENQQQAYQLVLQGEDKFQHGDLSLARTLFQQALEIDPMFILALNDLAVLEVYEGNIEAAFQYLFKAYEQDVDNKTTVINLSDVLQKLGQFNEAQQVLLEYLKNHPEDKEVQDLLENLHDASETYSSSINEFGESVSNPFIESAKLEKYYQPVAGNTEKYISILPVKVNANTQSVYQALKDYEISEIGSGLEAVKAIFQHIITNKLQGKMKWDEKLWNSFVVLTVQCELKDIVSNQSFDVLKPKTIKDISTDFFQTEGAEREQCILSYANLLKSGQNLGMPLYVSGHILQLLGGNAEPNTLFMVDGARRITASALAHCRYLDVLLILHEEEFQALLIQEKIDNLKQQISRIGWFSSYQSIPLAGLQGERTLKRFDLMPMDWLRDQTIMDFGCNLGQACIKAVQAGAKEVWGIEGFKETFNATQQIKHITGFNNLHYLNVDFNDPNFDQIINADSPDQVDYAFFFSVYRTKELTQRERLFNYIISKVRKGIFFEGHAAPNIDTPEYHDWLFDCFELESKFLGFSEGELRPLYFLKPRKVVNNSYSPDESKDITVTVDSVTPENNEYIISAIVSTYDSEEFIEGRLKNLLNQTLGYKVEIIVIDSCSPSNEGKIVSDFMKEHLNIKYLRTEKRETVYQAWNRGIKLSKAKYVTFANTDDRLRSDALEVMVNALEENPNIALVYGDIFITSYPNSDFLSHIRTGYSIKPEYTPEIMGTGCHMGPQPVWRKSVHEQIGFFDEKLKSASDFEFWCRMALHYRMLHLNEYLGLYFHNPKGIVNRDVDTNANETRLVLDRYKNKFGRYNEKVPTGFYYKESFNKYKYVNIGMVTYNRIEFTRQSIKSIITFTRYPYAITVVDNNSSDGTQSYLKDLYNKGIIKNLVLLKENVGVSKASNIAWQCEPKAEYYLKLDNDIVIQKENWLRDLVNVADGVRQAGVVGYSFEPVSYELKEIDGYRVRPKINANVGGACALIPRKTSDKIGFWCEDYGLYGEEDSDYGLRVELAGLMNVYMEDEDIGFHLPAGKAAIIDPQTYIAKDGLEEKIDEEYRRVKDENRAKNLSLGSKYHLNIIAYKEGKGLYVRPGSLSKNFIDYIAPDELKNNDVFCENKQKKIHIGLLVVENRYSACPNIRLLSILNALADVIEYRFISERVDNNTINYDADNVLWSDLIIVQRTAPADLPKNYLDNLLSSKVPIIYEIDDYLTGTFSKNHRDACYMNRCAPFMMDFIKKADGVTVSTEQLYNKYSALNNVTVLPNLIDTNLWKVRPPKNPGDKIVILYAGTGTHIDDLEMIEPALLDIYNRFSNLIKFIFFGCITQKLRELPTVEYIKEISYVEYIKVFENLEVDIAIAPLLDNELNNCKSNIKWLEYSISGIPGIYSDVLPYQNICNGKTGFLAKPTKQSWVEALEQLILKPALRMEIALTAQQEVNELFSISVAKDQYLDFWKGFLKTNKDGLTKVKDNVGEVFENKNIDTGNRRIAVVIHLFYIELWGEFERALTGIPGEFDLYISITQGNAKEVSSEILKSFPNAKIFELPNKGRDILPFLTIFKEIVPLNYDLILKLHSKKSPHLKGYSGVDDYGEKWRTISLSSLAHWKKRVKDIFDLFDSNPTLGIFAPFSHLCLFNSTDINFQTIDKLMPGIDRKAFDNSKFCYAGGSMFWFRPQAISRIFELNLSAKDFEDESGQLDGTLAHALERLFGVLCQTSGYLITDRMPGNDDLFYQDWLETQRENYFSQDRLFLSDNTINKPKIHCIIYVDDEDMSTLANTIDSIGNQVYQNWHLSVISCFSCPDETFHEMAQLSWLQLEQSTDIQSILFKLDIESEWVIFLDKGDYLEPHAFSYCIEYSLQNSVFQLIYTDEDKVSPEGFFHSPRFKPDFNLDLLYSADYMGGLVLFKTNSLLTLDKVDFPNPFINLDLTLRYLESSPESDIGHIASVLVHRRDDLEQYKKTYIEFAKSALINHFQRKSLEVVIDNGVVDGTFNINYRLKAESKISIIIPTKDQLQLLKACVDSVLSKSSYSNYEIIIIDNNSTEVETLEYFNDLSRSSAGRVRIVAYPKPYNFSAINNFAAKQAAGDYLVLLNNDTMVLQAEWLQGMLSQTQRSDVGIVGVKLVFPNKTLQHAGVVLGMGANGVAEHPHIAMPMESAGYMNRAALVQDFSAVTAACLMIEKKLYQQVGGLDEENFKVLYNDVDLCLKVREQGYKVLWTPDVTLIHHGSSSLKKVKQDPKRIQQTQQEVDNMLEKWLPQLANDPAYNRNLSLKTSDFQLESSIKVTWNQELRSLPLVYAFPASSNGVGEYRVRSPLRRLTKAGMIESGLADDFDKLVFPTPVEIERINPDVLFMQNGFLDWMREPWKRYRKFNDCFMVFGQDDLVYMLPHKHPMQGRWPKNLRRLLKDSFAYSDRLIVANDVLAEEFSKLTDEIVVVPNYLEKARWCDLKMPLKKERKKLRVGWAGGQEHTDDLEFIVPVVEALHKEVDWVFMGLYSEKLRPYIKEYHLGVHFEHYPQKLADLDLDLAIAPLTHNRFNEAKTNLRLLEYGIMGWPVVCSDIQPYKNAPVTRVANNTQHWVNVIRDRVSEPDQLQKDGLILRQWVLDNYMLDDHLEEWFRALIP